MFSQDETTRRKEARVNDSPDQHDQPDRPISRLRRDYRRRPVGWWILAFAVVLAVMILLPKIVARLG